MGGVTGVVLEFVIERGVCASSTLLPGEDNYNECMADDSGLSWPLAFGLGAGIAIPVWVAFPLYGGEWTPW